MNLPAGYTRLTVISPGPTARVTLAHGPDGGDAVLKEAAIARAVPAIAHEARVLGRLEHAGVHGVPRVLALWEGGVALERLSARMLGEQVDGMRRDAAFRTRAAKAAFTRLEAVHRAGVVHCDVSPGNVFVSADGDEAWLADFGLARMLDEDLPPDTGVFRGTLLYVAPEVARGAPADVAADVFALAASLLHVATGIPLRDPEGAPASVLVNAGSCPLDATHPWHRAAPALFPVALADALLRCLAFEPEARPREPSIAW